MLREDQPQEGQPADGRPGCFSFCHVPQQSRREKLRYANAGESAAPPPFNAHYFTSPYDNGFPPADFFNPNPNPNPNPSPSPLFGGEGFSLSLSPAMFADQQRRQSVASAAAPPVHRAGPVPSGPFTGYTTILNSSRFLRPAQQLLEETCGGGGAAVGGSLLAGLDDGETLDIAVDIPDRPDALDGEQRSIKSRLILMLDEVYRRYKQYDHQIQAVISSFESVSGLSMAAPYATLALRSLSKHFKSLKKAIADQLHFAGKCSKEAQSRPDPLTYGPTADSAIQPQPPWRPQRGLPERAVAVLRSWLFEHFLHPYPTDLDKQMLAKQTGLSRNQVSNWFINARVRLWKPMVEEIHSLEQQNDRRPENSGGGGTVSSGEKQAAPPVSGSPCKRSRGDFPQLQGHIKDPLNFSVEDLSKVPASFGGGVSLTLGLHQNSGSICFDAAGGMPMAQVHRYAIEEGGGVGFGMDFDGHLHHVF